MLVYEVNLEVDEEINFKFAGWLPSHINDVLAAGGFDSAYWFFREAAVEGLDPKNSYWTIHYVARDRLTLDRYLQEHAGDLRQEAISMFGDRFRATRRILHLLSVAGLPDETVGQAKAPDG